MTKPEVRAHAVRLGVPTAAKAESQDICFVGAKSAGDWLEAKTDAPAASLVALDGTRLGQRGSLTRYTVGQRRGLGLPPDDDGAPRFVVDKRADGTVLVGRREDLAIASLTLGTLNAPGDDWPAVGERVALQTRHRGAAVPARVAAHDGGRMTLTIEGLLQGAARGQHGVIFDGDAVRCGGVIVDTVRRNAA
jgi:tRNA-specific 2-thiouridylase